MKLYFVLPVFILLACVTVWAADEEPENIIRNGDFEAQFQDWSFWTEGGAVAMRLIDSKEVEPIDGDSVAYVDIDKKSTGGNHIQFFQGTFPLKKDEKYTLSVWMMGGEGGEPVELKVIRHENPWTTYAAKTIALKQEWSEYIIMAYDL